MRAPHGEALALLARAPWVHLACVGDDGLPVLRAVHGVLVEGALCFHGAPVGEKTAVAGRPAVASYEELVAEVPSYWTDAELACPATSLYVSVQAHGTVRLVADGAAKARALQALMARFQPEGGHAPIAYDDPRYARNVDGVAVWALEIERLDRKDKLAQNRAPAYVEAVVPRLWARGREGDPRAVELLLRANPKARRPDAMTGPGGTTLHPWQPPEAVSEALPLLRDAYWNAGRYDDAAIAEAHRRAAAWVVARDAEGALVATARAVSDGVKHAYLGDVAVREDRRGGGLGAALMALLLDHPAVRGARRVELATRDAEGFYARLGFAEFARATRDGHPRISMARTA